MFPTPKESERKSDVGRTAILAARQINSGKGKKKIAWKMAAALALVDEPQKLPRKTKPDTVITKKFLKVSTQVQDLSHLTASSFYFEVLWGILSFNLGPLP